MLLCREDLFDPEDRKFRQSSTPLTVSAYFTLWLHMNLVNTIKVNGNINKLGSDVLMTDCVVRKRKTANEGSLLSR